MFIICSLPSHLALQQVLTRRDQLKLKEEKVKSKQAEQEAKKAAKEEAALLRKQEQEKKKAAKKAEKAEKTAKNKPKKTKGKKAPEPVMESEKDTEMEVEDQEEPSDDNAEELPKPKAKAKAKAKGKAAAKKAEPKNEPKKPRRKRMPKSTAAEADEEPEGGKNDDDDDQEPHDGVETPKKALFQSDDDGEGPDDFSGGPAPHPHVDCRTGQVKPLEEIFNGDIPSRLSKACKKKEPKVKADASAASAVDPKPKKGTKRRAQVEISPSMKKEIRRRKKKEAEVMTHAPTEDVQIQGIFLHHLKACEGMPMDDLKEYLYQKVQKKFNKSALNPYLKRPACGVKLPVEGQKHPKEIVYFGQCGTAKSFNASAVVHYVAASLLVSYLNFPHSIKAGLQS